MRKIVVQIDDRRSLRLITNDLTSPAAEFAKLYNLRWAIELFFRLVKQTLKIARLPGPSENAVRTQVAAALITLLILQLAKLASRRTLNSLTFTRAVRANHINRKTVTSHFVQARSIVKRSQTGLT